MSSRSPALLNAGDRAGIGACAGGSTDEAKARAEGTWEHPIFIE